MSYYSADELAGLGLGSFGTDVLISRRASLHSPERIQLGSHVRIDDFALITCAADRIVNLGDHVHIAAHAALYGGGGIVLGDYVGVSGHSSIYSVTDDYGGLMLTNPTVPARFTSVIRKQVVLQRHVVLGAGSIVLPGVTIGEGSATGAMTLVTHDLEPWGLYVGAPARRLRPRSRQLLTMEAELHALESRDRSHLGGSSD